MNTCPSVFISFLNSLTHGILRQNFLLMSVETVKLGMLKKTKLSLHPELLEDKIVNNSTNIF